MIAYRYDSETFFYDGEQECQLDPLETEAAGHEIWLLPGNCTWEHPLPPKEGFNVKWNGEAWEYDEIPVPPEPEPPTLDEVKAAKIQELKMVRNTKELEPISYNGVLFDADKDSLDRLNYAIITLTVTHTYSIDWTTAKNTDVPMTVNDLNLVIASVGNRSNYLHITYRELKEQVNACTTVEEVEAITWPED